MRTFVALLQGCDAAAKNSLVVASAQTTKPDELVLPLRRPKKGWSGAVFELAQALEAAAASTLFVASDAGPYSKLLRGPEMDIGG